MRQSEVELIQSRPKDYQRAHQAAAFCLREDRRFLGAPKMRARLEELGALSALGSEKAVMTKSELADYSNENIQLYVDGLAAATKAATEALAPK